MAKMSRVVWGDWTKLHAILLSLTMGAKGLPFVISRFLPVGGSVEFYVFEDDAGLGAEECVLTEPPSCRSQDSDEPISRKS